MVCFDFYIAVRMVEDYEEEGFWAMSGGGELGEEVLLGGWWCFGLA